MEVTYAVGHADEEELFVRLLSARRPGNAPVVGVDVCAGRRLWHRVDKSVVGVGIRRVDVVDIGLEFRCSGGRARDDRRWLVRVIDDDGELSVGAFRFFERGLNNADARSSDALSMVIFEPEYLALLIRLGEEDAAARSDEIEAFLRGEACSVPVW